MDILTSVCSIVKNERENLSAMMDCLDVLADEFCVLDTGSTDGTPEIEHPKLRMYKSQRFTKETPWQQFHYADARNEGIERAQGEWVLILDPDYRMERADQTALYEFLGKDVPPNVAVVFLPIRNGDSLVPQPVCQRRSANIKYHGVVHEHIARPDTAVCMLLNQIVVTHLRGKEAMGPEVFNAKHARYRTLLETELAASPEDLNTMGLLATECCFLKDWHGVLQYAQMVLNHAENLPEAHVAHHMFQGAIAMFNMGMVDQAFFQMAVLVRMPPVQNLAHVKWVMAECCRCKGMLDDAEQWALAAMATPAPHSMYIDDYPCYREEKPKETLRLIAEQRQRVAQPATAIA